MGQTKWVKKAQGGSKSHKCHGCGEITGKKNAQSGDSSQGARMCETENQVLTKELRKFKSFCFDVGADIVKTLRISLYKLVAVEVLNLIDSE